jgi:hypothetical protein
VGVAFDFYRNTVDVEFEVRNLSGTVRKVLHCKMFFKLLDSLWLPGAEKVIRAGCGACQQITKPAPEEAKLESPSSPTRIAQSMPS